MKRKIGIVVLALLLLSGCYMPTDPVLDSLGEPLESAMWTWGEFQDFTDYGKYRYLDITQEDLEQNAYFSEVKEEEISLLQGYLANFEGWVAIAAEEGNELAEHYDFSGDMLTVGDYFYLDGHGYSDQPAPFLYVAYDIYYFLLDTQTLYYFHNNN